MMEWIKTFNEDGQLIVFNQAHVVFVKDLNEISGRNNKPLVQICLSNGVYMRVEGRYDPKTGFVFDIGAEWNERCT